MNTWPTCLQWSRSWLARYEDRISVAVNVSNSKDKRSNCNLNPDKNSLDKSSSSRSNFLFPRLL